MGKYFVSLLLIILLAPLVIQAQTVRLDNPLAGGGVNNIWDLLSRVIDFIWQIAIPLAALLIVIGGYFFLASAGDPEKVRKAKHLIIYTLVGLLVIFLSKAIINMLAERFGLGPLLD
jgi:ABC-type microcin C transport system permease subunit YejB